MFLNLLPGAGLGFTGSKEIAFGLAPVSVSEISVPPVQDSPGGGGGWPISVRDNLYSRRDDDNEIIEILSILFRII